MIDVDHICKSFGTTKAIDDVSLHVDRHEVVSIIGHSGSGKSTLLRCIAGLECYEEGSITIGTCGNGRYNGVGMVFQEDNLFGHLTVLQNLTLAPVHVLGMSEEEAREKAMHLLDTVGMWARSNDYPVELSSGQCQRVAIARSLMMNPEVLLLDEPTSSLDPVSASEVLDVLSTLKKHDITIVMVTHKLRFARSLSDRIVFMHNGKIYEQGTPAEIINNPQHPLTISYINHSLNMVYDIASERYDHPELNARIEDFCMRYRLAITDTHAIQLVVEELLNLVPLNKGVRLVVANSEHGVEVNAVFADSERECLRHEKGEDDLSYTIVEAMCSSIEEHTNDMGERVIRLIVKKDII